MPERSAFVAVCCNQAMVFTKTAQSLMEIGWGDRIRYAKDRTGFDRVDHGWYTGSPRVDMLRNQAVADALKRDYTHLIFLDADMVWPTDTIYKLLQHHDRGIVAGLYVLKGPPYSPVHLVDQFEKDGVQQFYRAREFGTDLVPVDVVGMGCTILPVSVCRDMGTRDWFRYDTDQAGWPKVSEDVPFCLAAKAQGVPRYMDPTIKCGHVTPQVIDHRWHYRYQKAIEEAATMGPAVTLTTEREPAEVS